jgi:hypothetical protein
LTPFEVAEGVLRVSSGWLEAEVPVRATCGPITASATSTVDWLGLLEAAIQGGDYDLMEWIRTSAPTSLAVATSSLDAIHRARERVALVAELESSVGDPSLDRVRRQRLSSIWYSAITHGWQPSEGQLETFMRNVMGQREQFRSERQQPAQPIQMETLRVGQLPWAALARGANPTNEELSLALGSYATASETQEVIHVARAWTMARSRDDLVLTAAEDEVGRKAFREWGRRLRADLVRNP